MTLRTYLRAARICLRRNVKAITKTIKKRFCQPPTSASPPYGGGAGGGAGRLAGREGWPVGRLARRFHLFVLADMNDSTLTLSPALLARIHLHVRFRAPHASAVLAFAFRLPDGHYAFTVTPDLPPAADNPAVAMVAYDTRARSVGFHLEAPSVSRILLDYGLTAPIVRLPVTISYRRVCGRRAPIFILLPPCAKSATTSASSKTSTTAKWAVNE